jgi:mono/diheme cytochrome c family protein
MKKLAIITGLVALVAFTGCSDVRRTPGKVYMPDMAYSRAVETYSDHSYLNAEGINYNAKPVAGTVKRGDEFIYQTLKDTAGTYNLAASMVNPLPKPDTAQLVEAERLYLINCGICHGDKLNGNGPLYKDGSGPYPAKPATLVGDAKYEAMAEGTMFHSITYGKNLMGAYASQVTPKQRWMIISYIKSKQNGGKGSTAATTTDSTKTMATSPAATKDSSVKK